MKPMLTVVLLTYNRLEYAKQTIKSALRNIKFSGLVNVHIADDGSDNHNSYCEELVETVYRMQCDNSELLAVTCSNSERGGYGKNYNLAMQVAHLDSTYVLPLEDDWKLEKELDIDLLAKVFEEDSRVGSIRLGYIGYTQPLRGEFLWACNKNWLLLDPSSPEPHVFAGHPRLETVPWERKVGPWPEGLLPGETEFAVAQRPEAREGVVWPIDLIRTHGDMFSHIGTIRSY